CVCISVSREVGVLRVTTDCRCRFRSEYPDYRHGSAADFKLSHYPAGADGRRPSVGGAVTAEERGRATHCASPPGSFPSFNYLSPVSDGKGAGTLDRMSGPGTTAP